MDDNALQAAAESYAADRLTLYPFPKDAREFQLLMEVAFMQGAQWYNERAQAMLQTRIDELNKEASNARS